MENKTEMWDKVWKNKDWTPSWDYLSQVILSTLSKESKGLKGKKVLEAGSGSGRISMRIAKKGGKVTLLDISPEAISLSRKNFKKNNLTAEFQKGSLFKIPSKNNTYDIVWNAGVIEHFYKHRQEKAIKEMLRICKKGGLVITLNPYAGSILHTLGKAVVVKLAKEYPFGREVPIKSLKWLENRINTKLKKKEYSIGFILLWIGALKRVLLIIKSKILFKLSLTLNSMACSLDKSRLGSPIRTLDTSLSKIFGGYLLVSIFEKK
jgi:ubiquinone/menaquinone biosynthesis C-methylase UbiE